MKNHGMSGVRASFKKELMVPCLENLMEKVSEWTKHTTSSPRGFKSVSPARLAANCGSRALVPPVSVRNGTFIQKESAEKESAQKESA